MIIATKVWGPMDKEDPNARGLSRHHIMCAVEQSLQRLQTDYIDLYQVRTLKVNLQTFGNSSNGAGFLYQFRIKGHVCYNTSGT